MLSDTSSFPVSKPNGSAAGRWLSTPRPRAGARARLILASHAGASPAWYAEWANDLPPEIELNLLHLPGRGSRYAEKAETDFASLIATLTQVLLDEFDGPYGLYGHSLGGLIAFELAREFGRQGGQQPLSLIVSGCPAPHMIAALPRLSDLSDDAFVYELKQLGGTPVGLLENDEILQLMLPSLRADMTLFESYVHTDQARLDCPILALGGSEDRHAGPSALEGWCKYTSAGFVVQVFSGGHFFIREHRGRIAQIVADEILQQVTGG